MREPPTQPPSLWDRIRAFLVRPFRREPAPGRYESGAKLSWRGFLQIHPLVWPRREYLIYLPRAFSRWRRAPLLVLCHGCKQTPEDFAAATRSAPFADRAGWLLLLPRQKDSANPWRCWNWFDVATVDGRGEAAIIAAQIRVAQRHYRADAHRVLVAGMSAGGALAAVVALRHPHLVRGAIVHSGLACGAAATPMSALAVMKRGPETDVERIADDARRRASSVAPRVALLAIHGERDDIVAPRNAWALVRQFLRFNDHPVTHGDIPATSALPVADRVETQPQPDGRTVTTHDWLLDGRLVVRYVQIADLGHAWTGGDARVEFNDSRAPDALSLIESFATAIEA